MIRPAGQQDVRFLRDMLRHAYHWRVGDLDAPVYRYVANWGRPGDFGLIRLEGMHSVAAAWYRLFPDSEPGFGFVDAATPELTIAVVPSRRSRGYARELLEALLAHAREDGFGAISLSSPRERTALYERFGFAQVEDKGAAVTMRAQL